MAQQEIIDDLAVNNAKNEGFYTVEEVEAVFNSASIDVPAHSLRSAGNPWPESPGFRKLDPGYGVNSPIAPPDLAELGRPPMRQADSAAEGCLKIPNRSAVF